MLTDSKHGVHIFVMATYGEGDPTDNAVEFMKWLADVPSYSDLSHIKFTVATHSQMPNTISIG